jgi:hypothetical protein
MTPAPIRKTGSVDTAGLALALARRSPRLEHRLRVGDGFLLGVDPEQEDATLGGLPSPPLVPRGAGAARRRPRPSA